MPRLHLGCGSSQFLLVTFCTSHPLHLIHLYIYSSIVIVANVFITPPTKPNSVINRIANVTFLDPRL